LVEANRINCFLAESDRIREIIFGGQMQEYERRFTDLQREMERVLASMLMEIATRLETGSSVTGLPEGLSKPSEE
jgi:hypothetical protein